MTAELTEMNKDALVIINVCRNRGEIVYSIDCAGELTTEELEHYLKEIINGICAWKPGVCEEKTRRLSGTIKKKST